MNLRPRIEKRATILKFVQAAVAMLIVSLWLFGELLNGYSFGRPPSSAAPHGECWITGRAAFVIPIYKAGDCAALTPASDGTGNAPPRIVPGGPGQGGSDEGGGGTAGGDEGGGGGLGGEGGGFGGGGGGGGE